MGNEIKDKTIEVLKELAKKTGCEKCGRLDSDIPTLTLTPTCLAKLCLPCARAYETFEHVRNFRFNFDMIGAALVVDENSVIAGVSAVKVTKDIAKLIEERHQAINKIHEFTMKWLEGENE